MIGKIYMLGYKHRALVALFLLLVKAFAGTGMQRLQVDTGIDSLIPADDPSRLVYQKVIGERTIKPLSISRIMTCGRRRN